MLSTTAYADGHNAYSTSFSGEPLYWKAREGSADNWAQRISPAGTTQTATVEDVPFQYSPGVRINLNRNNREDHWNINAIFTHYQTREKTDASGQVYSAYLGNFYSGNTDGSGFGPYYDYGSVDWKINYNTFDIELGRKFYIATNLQFNPTFGLKAALIYQDINTRWSGPNSSAEPPVVYDFNTATEELNNNFKGLGPTIRFAALWNFYQRNQNTLNIVTNAQGGLLWGTWHFKDKYATDTQSTVSINYKNIDGAATMASMHLGLQWQHACRSMEVIVGLGYEAQVWFNQMQYYSYNMGRLNHPMSLQGGTFNIGLSF